jgi:hypothetical protein
LLARSTVLPTPPASLRSAALPLEEVLARKKDAVGKGRGSL